MNSSSAITATAATAAASASDFSGLSFSNGFASLPPAFYTHLQPSPLPEPYLVGISTEAAALIGLDPAIAQQPDFIEVFTGNKIAQGSRPLAAVYSGHQFGVWAGQLGDGRAILLGDVAATTAITGGTMELQLKGAGQTPYSRMGDGRAVLRSSIREFLCSEAMAALGIPTTRALCITGSDYQVRRESMETTAVVTRMSPSFIRFGSFEHWYYNQRPDELKLLADSVIDHFYPELREKRNPYAALLTEVTSRTAHLMAQWQAVGFMHGVMNTDNMSILGLTLDYGPFGFMEAFDARHICNHTDQQGRYSYQMQPRIGQWNCFALGQALLPLIGSTEETEAALADYQAQFSTRNDALLHAKLGLKTQQQDDGLMVDAMFALLQANHADFTLFFRRLSDVCSDARNDHSDDEHLRDLFIDRDACDAWLLQYRARLRQENSNDAERKLAMDKTNPKYVLRNYLAQLAIEKAQNKDFSELATLQKILSQPFDEQPEYDKYAELPPDWASHLEVSCSS